MLNERLAAKQQEQEATELAAVQKLHASPTKDDEPAVNPLQPVASIDVTSRLYRIPGSRTIFVLPAYGIHPGTEGTREMESRPLIQTVVRPEVGVRTTAQGRRDAARINELYTLAHTRQRRLMTMRHQLQTTTAELNTTRQSLRLAQLRAGEARASERAQLARIMKDKADEDTKVEADLMKEKEENGEEESGGENESQAQAQIESGAE
ncbi:MAG: hypothetical protein M1830_005384 [Pleopsidium flavum]|nr:MAG: hypothetical protein M1830_005384 [Pleopsidium flavum]